MGNNEIIVIETVGVEHETAYAENGTSKRLFKILNAESPEAANRALIDFVLANHRTSNGVPAKRMRLIEPKEHGGLIYEGEVEYRVEKTGTNKDSDGNEFTLPTFSMRGGTKRVTRPIALKARATRKKPGTEENEPYVDYKMIGWNGEEFTGCEVPAPDLEFMVPVLIPAENVNYELICRLSSTIGNVNDDVFYGLEAGEVMYLGPEQSYKTLSIGPDESGNTQYATFVELHHHFKCQPNLYQVQFGDCDPVDIGGWDYPDVKFTKELVNIGDTVNPGQSEFINEVELAVPEQVDVWQVCPESDLSLLLS